MSRTTKLALLITGAALLILAAYYSGIPGYFNADDFIMIYVSSPLSSNSLSDIFFSGRSWTFYRPMVNLTFLADYCLYGTGPAGYHLTNLFLHLINVLLVFHLGKLLTGNMAAAVLSCLIFAVHPVNTEAVTWISGRGDLLFFLFYLLSISAFNRHLADGKWKRTHLFLSCALFVPALLSKETAITLPVILFLMEFFFYKGASQPKKTLLLKYLPFMAIMVLYPVIRFSMGVYVYQYSMGAETIKRVIYYFFQLFFPIDVDRLNFGNVNLLILNIAIIIIVGTAAISYLLFSGKKSGQLKFFAFCAAWIIITSFPVYLVTGKRFLYISSAVSSVILGVLLIKLYEASKRFGPRSGGIVLAVLFSALLLSFSARTIQRNDIYSRAGRITYRILSQMKSSHPAFPEGSVLYCFNFPYKKMVRDTETWIKLFDNLEPTIRFAYEDPSLTVHFNRSGQITTDSGIRLFVEAHGIRRYINEGKSYYIFKFENGEVVEATDRIRI